MKSLPYSNEDYVTKDVIIYELNPKLHIILDSVIAITKTYHLSKTEFALKLQQGRIKEIGREDTIQTSPSDMILSICAIYDPLTYNYDKKVKGVFYYKSHKFYVEGMFRGDWLIETNQLR
jgi:hypothetical protein